MAGRMGPALRLGKSAARAAGSRRTTLHRSLASLPESDGFSSSFGEYSYFLSELGLSESVEGVSHKVCRAGGDWHTQVNPATGKAIGRVRFGTLEDYEAAMAAMTEVKSAWAETPAPSRGEVIRQIGLKLREKQEALGSLVSLETGKIRAEGVGEVQEAVDICDYALGLSRCLNGQVMPSERPGHFMMERYNPLKGHVGIITAFNFPVAVYFWNLALSLVCGNTSLWKPAESASFVSVACTKLVAEALQECGQSPALASMVCAPGGGVGAAMAADPRMELVSFTGSTATGRKVNVEVAARLGKTILELGGNNAMVINNDADLDLALRATVFSAVGTAGQRCTTLRRLLVRREVYAPFVERLQAAYDDINSQAGRVGDPLAEGTLCGPLHNQAAMETFRSVVERVSREGGRVLSGGRVLGGPGHFVEPTLVEMPSGDCPLVREENFVPVLYVIPCDSLEEAIEANNDVPQGLSSSLFTSSSANAFRWTGPSGSDCGLVNVNIGPSGAEIGGAFGGEKDTGGGRESGSDAWKQYMRRSTCTINHSDALPLAQGISFE